MNINVSRAELRDLESGAVCIYQFKYIERFQVHKKICFIFEDKYIDMYVSKLEAFEKYTPYRSYIGDCADVICVYHLSDTPCELQIMPELQKGHANVGDKIRVREVGYYDIDDCIQYRTKDIILNVVDPQAWEIHYDQLLLEKDERLLQLNYCKCVDDNILYCGSFRSTDSYLIADIMEANSIETCTIFFIQRQAKLLSVMPIRDHCLNIKYDSGFATIELFNPATIL